MRKNQSGFSALEGLLVLVVILAIGFIGWYVFGKNRNSATNQGASSSQSIVTNGKTVSFTGKVESVDLSAMASDGPGVFKINTGQQSITVHLDAGESSCDREAITAPHITAGNTVQVKGTKASNGIVLICDKGTYIRFRTTAVQQCGCQEFGKCADISACEGQSTSSKP